MDKTDRELFGQALAEALAERFEEELAACEESAVCSEDHYRKMQEIICPSARVPKRKFSRKSLLAIIIAAALLLTGCAAYICRNEIRDFVEEVYEKFVRLTYCESYKKSSAEIDEIYKLTYVPEGYELVEEDLQPISNYYKYTNSNGEFILFKQVVLDTTEVGLDVEEVYTGLYEFNGLKIYCRTL
ncbi:MAG: DUF4367 domain-containing protein, partial [Clostridia bacterium]|nr:DUF4367 domain-containing protein [Clostridia bacterium]